MMKIAIPVTEGLLSMHFGHCDQFALLEVDLDAKTITSQMLLDAPPHQPGLLPPWLAGYGVQLVIAGGMGQRAVGLFGAQNIQVITGAPSAPPEQIVKAYMEGTLTQGVNACDH